MSGNGIAYGGSVSVTLTNVGTPWLLGVSGILGGTGAVELGATQPIPRLRLGHGLVTSHTATIALKE